MNKSLQTHLRDRLDLLQWFGAVEAGDKEIIQKMLDADFPIDYPNEQGFTALSVCARLGIESVAQLLVERGAQMGQRLGGDNLSSDMLNSTLWWAIEKQHPGVALLLIEAGADVTLPTNNRGSLLHHTIFCGNGCDMLPVFCALLDRGLDPDHKNSITLTPRRMLENDFVDHDTAAWLRAIHLRDAQANALAIEQATPTASGAVNRASSNHDNTHTRSHANKLLVSTHLGGSAARSAALF